MTAPNQNHLDNYTFTFSLDPPPARQAVFSSLLVLADEAAGNTLGGDRYKEYGSYAEAEADSANLSAFVLAGLSVGFTQRPKIPSILVGRVDTGNATPEGYDDGLIAVEAAGADYYGVVMDSRDDTDILDLAQAVSTRRKLVGLQADNTDLYDGNLSASTLADLATYGDGEHTIMCFHDDDTEWADLGLMANRLAFNPDNLSVPWDTPVSSVGGYTTVLETGEKNQLDTNNINHGLALSSESFHMDPGVNIAGRPIYEIYTLHWFETRLEERLSALKVKLSKRGHKLIVDRKGQGKVLALVRGLFEEATKDPSPHFLAGQTDIQPVTITDADRDAQRMRFTGAATFAVSGRKFEFTMNFTRQPIFEAAA